MSECNRAGDAPASGTPAWDPWAWSERQARLLRRVAAGQRASDAGEVDWAGVIVAIESVGVAELNATRTLLRHALALLLQIRGWPDSERRSAWLIAVGGALADVAIHLTPAMRPHIDVAALYQLAHAQISGVALDGQLPLALPLGCPFTLDDLLRGDRAQLEALLVPTEEL
jgi:hypothetical protein